ncbi:nucleoside phosphorylase [Lutimonas zeaxanthinifaciens]|uniref:nucleoside phosphorylase n=1 Tax=Lutimonas zeaxanthinifaciens TaxID=3060215 RepID=UPI00265C9476|nr:nucleoside phosphorylase [Lutimonas sp. YSD2104]WKK66729.1 nucleoside phosphorylase [Lutimonas sp. YSD2104]
MRIIGPSELILNPDGSIYHINLKPEHIAPNIIFVGDQNRVEKVSKHFDHIEFSTQKREFKSVVGSLNNKRFTVISTGIGPDNIDIVLNEIDALVNIDLENRTVKPDLTSLNIVRMGTSGSFQNDIPVDSIVLGKYGLGFDGVLHSYNTSNLFETELENAFIEHTSYSEFKSRPYIVKNSGALEKTLDSEEVFAGITATAIGFYGPQGRVLRLGVQDKNLNEKIQSFNFKNLRVTNLEMETSVIYGLSKLLGHKAVSMNAIIANRANLTFSKDPYKAVEKMIKYSLQKLSE